MKKTFTKRSQISRDIDFIRRWAKKIKAIRILGGKCEKCGNCNVFVLDFHHKRIKKKIEIINAAINRHWGQVLSEIKKCKLLCRNCHMEAHYPDSNPNKEALLNIRGQHKCSKCGYRGKSTASLDFHHKNKESKEITISYSYKKRDLKVPSEEVLNEIKKCDVYCKNCHAIQHIDVKRFQKLRSKIYSMAEKYTGLQKLDVGKIITLRKSGLRAFEIAKNLHYLSASVLYVINKLEPNRTSEIANNREWRHKKILSLYKAGLDQLDIAKRVKCGQSTVSRNLIREGIRDDHSLRRWHKLKI